MSADGEFAKYISGDKLYQERARKALPLLVGHTLLVRQARVPRTILYSELAPKLGMEFPLNLNYVLGHVGNALKLLSDEWAEEIPPIQCMVVSKQTWLPGEGVGWFLKPGDDFYDLPRKLQHVRLRTELQKVYEYPRWSAVLTALGLLAKSDEKLIHDASKPRLGGESDDHRRLKRCIAEHPEILKLPESAGKGTVEFPLPSGDSIDVLFQAGDAWTAAEVKSARSPLADIIRGMFQCVKYRAVIEALQTVCNLPQSARAVLVLESEFPEELTTWKQMLGIEVIDLIRPQSQE